MKNIPPVDYSDHPELASHHKSFVVRTDEKRISGKVRVLQIGAVLCALFASAGIANGIHEAAPDNGWLIPIFAGVIAAAAFAGIWHVLIGAVVGMVRMSMIIATFVGAIILTLIALGASATAIATAVAGKAAIAAELSNKVDAYGKSLADAYVRATSWRGAADAANVLAVGLNGRAETEESGGNGTGSGCGPKCSSLRDAAQSFRTGADALLAMLAVAAEDNERGQAAMAALRIAATNGDQVSFMAAAEEVAGTVATLNAVDPKPIVDMIGMVEFSDKGIDLSAETTDFRAKANAALANRPEAVAPPVFKPLDPVSATRAQIFGAASHGWILAGAIDVLPLLFLAFTFIMSREVWLQEPVERRNLTARGRNERDRHHLADLHGRTQEDNSTVIHMPSPSRPPRAAE